MDLSFCLVVQGLVLALHKENGGDLHAFKGKIHLDSMSMICFCFVAPFVAILLILIVLVCLQVTG